MRINEIFYSIQGEGINLGKPSIFVRLTGCNLKCVWCDTKYTWLFDLNTFNQIKNKIPKKLYATLGDTVYDKSKETKHMSIDELISKIKIYPTTHIVITGGEPLLQKKEIIKLVNYLSSDFTIEIETNGTISPNSIPVKIQFNVSPKLSNSYNDEDIRIKNKILKEFLHFNSIFKFVITSDTDLKEVINLKEELNISANRIFLMPEGDNEEELRSKSIWLIELCKKYNFIFTPRIHISIFGQKRGV